MPTPERPSRQELIDATVRDPLAAWPAILEARRLPMSERLALALSWNKLASELRAGLAAAIERERQEAPQGIRSDRRRALSRSMYVLRTFRRRREADPRTS